MKVMLAVARVELKLIFLIVNLEASVGDAVGKTPGSFSCTRTVAIIIRGVGITQHDIVTMAIAVRSDDAHDACADVAQLHLNAIAVG